MKKTILLFIIISLAFLSVVGCANKKNLISKDAIKFKEEYESLNNTSNSDEKVHRSLSISENNPFVYSNAKEILKKIENKETFYIYFGSSYCPWCRSVIEKVIEVAKKNNISTIYYIDIWNGDHNEILRDTYELDENNEIKLVSKGAKEYQDLIRYLNNVLGEYTLTSKDGQKILVGEKRIFAPNFIYIKDGKAVKLESGNSDKQTDSRMDLTEEILKDEEIKFNEFFKNDN